MKGEKRLRSVKPTAASHRDRLPKPTAVCLSGNAFHNGRWLLMGLWAGLFSLLASIVALVVEVLQLVREVGGGDSAKDARQSGDAE